MAFAKMSPGHKYAVTSFFKRLDDKCGINPSGTHDPYGSYAGWILQAGNPCQIGSGIGTPVAQKCNYFGLKFLHYFT
jgi:hypothetical protein